MDIIERSAAYNRPDELSDAEHKRYRAYFNRLNSEDRELFKTSKCLLAISVGRHYHENGRFGATLNLVNKFGSCVVLVADLLQRHSISILNLEKSEKELLDMSIQAGTDWIERNTPVLKATLQIPYKIIRWDMWLYHNKFESHYDWVCKLYQEDLNFKIMVDETVATFLSRVQKRTDYFDIERAAKLSLKYIVEESAIMCLWMEEAFSFIAYPGEGNKAMDYMCHKFAQQRSLTIPRYLEIVFNKTAYKAA